MDHRAVPLFVVVSGIPGSGKTTLGRKLATALRLPFFDKDDILEGLFESEGVGDAAWRRQLSRKSDDALIRKVKTSVGAVVVSFWQTEVTGNESGTPIEWIRQLAGQVVEIHCKCDPAVAAERFNGRHRHPGHLDGQKPAADTTKFALLASASALRVGKLVIVDTSGVCDVGALATAVTKLTDPP